MHENKMFQYNQEFLTWLNQNLLNFFFLKSAFIKFLSFDATKRCKITKCPAAAAVL